MPLGPSARPVPVAHALGSCPLPAEPPAAPAPSWWSRPPPPPSSSCTASSTCCLQGRRPSLGGTETSLAAATRTVGALAGRLPALRRALPLPLPLCAPHFLGCASCVRCALPRAACWPRPSCPWRPRPNAVCGIAHEEDRRSGVNVREVPGGAGEGSSRPWFHFSGASEDGGGFPSGAGMAGDRDARGSLEGGHLAVGYSVAGDPLGWAGLDLNPPRTLSRIWLLGPASGPTGRLRWVGEPRRAFWRPADGRPTVGLSGHLWLGILVSWM